MGAVIWMLLKVSMAVLNLLGSGFDGIFHSKTATFNHMGIGYVAAYLQEQGADSGYTKGKCRNIFQVCGKCRHTI